MTAEEIKNGLQQLSELSEIQKDTIHVLGSLSNLKSHGLIDLEEPTGGLTESGMKLYQLLRILGYNPPADRLMLVVSMYRRIDDEPDPTS